MLPPKLDALRSSLSRTSKPTFADARARRPELAAFPSPLDIAAALDSTASPASDHRYAIIAALVAEHRASRNPLWSSLLLVAFRPLLLRLRTRLGRPEDEERDARVLAAFLEALATLTAADAGPYAAVALQRRTIKALAAQRRSERLDADSDPFEEGDHTPCSPHALTLGDALVDAAWADARERKLVALSRVRPATPRLRETQRSAA